MKLLFPTCLTIAFLLGMPTGPKGQSPGLPPGFDAAEYADMLWLAFHGFSDSMAKRPTAALEKGQYHRVLRTPEVGLRNKAELYLRDDGTIILSLRGTVAQAESWLENFYAGMIPATGSLQLGHNFTFNYKLADRPDAMVHTGWTIGTGFLAREYLPVLDSLLQTGKRRLIVTGHSQGGALSFLNTSLVYYRFSQKYPGLAIKTYASAAPKPGNLYYAYDLESITGNGYAYRIVNANDWVPESPISVQGVADFNKVNPLGSAPETIKKQKFPERVALKHMYNKMRKGSERAARRYQRYLGGGVGKLVKKSLPGYVPPTYSRGSNYSTAGAPIILMPDEAYRSKFPDNGNNVFIHHMYAPYFFLLQKYFPR
ncbi:MAG TPA: lipase family protein [Phnomibacter sp.]|nr:lipase family protein [Phnomibacter sp.]